MDQANLVYTSRAVTEIDAKVVSELAEEAARRNEKIHVTGILICGGGHFLQVLEGDRSTLTSLYAKIASDARHTDCSILLEQAHTPRRFPSFHMGHLSLGEPTRSDRAAWERLCSKANNESDILTLGSDPVVTLVRTFMERFGNKNRQSAA